MPMSEVATMSHPDLLPPLRRAGVSLELQDPSVACRPNLRGIDVGPWEGLRFSIDSGQWCLASKAEHVREGGGGDDDIVTVCSKLLSGELVCGQTLRHHSKITRKQLPGNVSDNLHESAGQHSARDQKSAPRRPRNGFVVARTKGMRRRHAILRSAVVGAAWL